jgi:DNA-binding response OmpR family regulator
VEQSYGGGGSSGLPWIPGGGVEPSGRSSVLVVEDDPDIREMLRTLLELAGFDCVATESAEGGLTALRQEVFDLVLTDYSLPRRSGVWLLETAESEGLLQGVPTLIVTAHPSIDQAGRFEVVQKPFDLDDLVERVRQRMDGARPKRLPMPVDGRSEHGSDGTGMDGREPVELVLYVSAHSPHSAAAMRTLQTVLARFKPSSVRLTVRDLTADPASGAEDSIAFTPTLVRRKPAPRTFIVGHLSNPEVLMELLADCHMEEH